MGRAMDFFIYGLALFITVTLICYFLCREFTNDWQNYPENRPVTPGYYVVWYLVIDPDTGGQGGYTALAEWIQGSRKGDYWRDTATGDVTYPQAFYPLPARNWHE